MMGVSPGHAETCPARSGHYECQCDGTISKPIAPPPSPPPASGKQVGGTHYEDMPMMPFDIIDAFDLEFYRGNALKYLLRAGRKPGADEIEELEKARHYLDEAIKRVQA